MKHLLVYVENLRSREARGLRKILGEGCQVDSVLPIVSEPVHSEDQLHSMLEALEELQVPPERLTVIVACSEVETPVMIADEAVRHVKSHESWFEFLRSFHVESHEIKFRAKEHKRCWVLAAITNDGGIPPGMGFLVDKTSGTVFPRRIADIISTDGNLI